MRQVSTNSKVDPVRAVLIGIDFGQPNFLESMSELHLLAQAAGSFPVRQILTKRLKPDPKLFIGSGKVEEIQAIMLQEEAQIAIFNNALSPAQQRNLERSLDRHVIDRTSLILDIFAQRAKSHIGQVQVELANVRYRLSRLVRAWSHLERQKGGIGLRGGPGETQMELDRRMLENRAKRLGSDLGKLQKQQATQRRHRTKRAVFSISIVGYTNAGKSTLFNALTKAGTYAADQLFATLDTTTRRLYLPEFGNAVISDTVGFIRELPHQLVEAFRATLDETVHADLLLHVVDAASLVREEQIDEVNKVLAEIGAQNIPVILVMNKIDQLPEYVGRGPELRYEKDGKISKVYLSARSGEGLELLRGVLATIAQETDKIRRLENFEVTQAEVGEPVDVLADRPVSADYLLSFNDARLGYLPRDI
ncbi:MAG: GTPase HflX [Burkholderiales bacterium]|nr:GTPase HflX [Burkholderiales bacterium]